ncbi:MAG: hypothetical protein MI700_03965, partial [Balneolales bacterium]|nr:hypothetical protein [Balneolales bacterium]
LAFLSFFSISALAQDHELNQRDVALINESFHLQKQLGNMVWKGWSPRKVPFLYKKEGFDYLLFHENPPDGYKPYPEILPGASVYRKVRTDSLDLEATMDINGIPTVVMTSPTEEESSTEWILKATHEMFHVFQFTEAMSDQLSLEFSKNFEETESLSQAELFSAFNSGDILASLRLEADRVYKGITKDSLVQYEKNLLIERLGDIQLIQYSIAQDSMLLGYKARTEWTEGVARYVETQLANLASQADKYNPSKEFLNHFPEASFEEKTGRYTTSRVLNPIRFVGAGVKGRVMFYYMGMGKAYLLDRIHPEWKEYYFDMTLDELIENAK